MSRKCSGLMTLLAKLHGNKDLYAWRIAQKWWRRREVRWSRARPHTPSPRPIRVERAQSLHRLDRRRPHAPGRGRGDERRGAPGGRDRPGPAGPAHLGPHEGDPHRRDHAARRRSILAAGAAQLAAERAPLRRPHGQGQEGDRRPVRHRAGQALAPLLRRAAAAHARRRPAQQSGRPALPRRAAGVHPGDGVPEGRRRAGDARTSPT